MTQRTRVFDPLRRHHADPYPHYKEFREHDPVHHERSTDGVVLTRYEDCLHALRDPRFTNDARALRGIETVMARHERAGGDRRDFDDRTLLNLDGPEHARLRGLVARAFTPRAIAALEPRIEGIADELLDGVRRTDSFDVMEAFANPLPAIVIAEMLGVPREDRPRFQVWATAAVEGGALADRETRRRGIEASYALRDYFERIVEVRRQDPRDDILGGLIRAEEADGDRLSSGELISSCSLLLIAGHVTTSAMIGSGLLALLRNPEQLALLRSNPELWPSAVEEILRFDSAIHSMFRFAREALSIRGKCIQKGQTALLVLAAANRDPETFASPDRFDITRSPNEHLTFGRGRHICLGASLARMEIRIALDALLRRLPQLSLAVPDIEWARGVIRTPTALPVRSGPV
jgi:cytochrome P450